MTDYDFFTLYTTNAAWHFVRANRTRLPAMSDWTQALDAPLTIEQRAAWSDYRQALRDIPQEFDHPDDVVFPEAPDA